METKEEIKLELFQKNTLKTRIPFVMNQFLFYFRSNMKQFQFK